MKRLLFTAALVFWAVPALAQVYPTCSGPIGGNTSCTMTIHVTSAATPIFAKLSSRQYLFVENTGYNNAVPPVLVNNPVWCALGSANAPIVGVNTFVIQPGGVYEPPQIVKPQNAFTVPSQDVSCIAPLGDAWLSVEQE